MRSFKFDTFPVITTERLVLRPLTYADENEIFYLRSDLEIHTYLDRPLAQSLDDARAFIDRVTKGFENCNILYWGICLKDELKIIGTVCLWKISAELEQAETGYELMLQYRGKGYIQEALKAVLDYGFNILNLKTIEAEVSPGNAKSVGLLKGFGFTKFEKDNIYNFEINNEEYTEFYKLEKKF